MKFDRKESTNLASDHAAFRKSHGIMTAFQLRQANDQFIRTHMGVVGLRLLMELRGVSCLELDQCPAPKQGITCSRAFGKSVTTLVEMEEAGSSYVERAAEKLRTERLACTNPLTSMGRNGLSASSTAPVVYHMSEERFLGLEYGSRPSHPALRQISFSQGMVHISIKGCSTAD